MSDTVRPIHIPSAAACDALRTRAQAALDAWAREWAIGCASSAQPAPALRVSVAFDDLRSQVLDGWQAVRSEAGCVWFRNRTEDRMRLGAAVVGTALMSGSGYVDEWIDAIAERAWQARSRAVGAALLGAATTDEPNASLSSALMAFGSGAVLLSCEELGLHAIADSGVWQSAPITTGRSTQESPAVTPLDRAMHQAKARVDVMLGSVELDLPRLLDLRRGDVLRLPQRLDDCIHVLCEGQPLARALLGEAQGRKCVQVLPIHHEEKTHDHDRE